MENGKPYVFVSYAHKNSDVVMPCIQAMKMSSINAWYDEGIQAGSEWPEFIAEKVVSCSKFVLFVSKAYLESQNCKRELNFAISRKKDILSVFLEDVELSPGMEMQLGPYQAIYRNRFGNDEAFFRSIASEPFFDACRDGALAPQPQTPPVPPRAPYQPPQGPAYAPPVPPQGRPPYQQPVYPPQGQPVYNPPLPVKSRVVAALLAIFLGAFGIHKFYLGKPVAGVLYLIFFWAYIPSIISFIEGIMLLCMNDEKFAYKYRCRIS